MKTDKKTWATLLGVVCGAELVIAAIIGGAGLRAFFGREGFFVGAIAAGLVLTYIFNKRRRLHPTTTDQPDLL